MYVTLDVNFDKQHAFSNLYTEQQGRIQNDSWTDIDTVRITSLDPIKSTTEWFYKNKSLEEHSDTTGSLYGIDILSLKYIQRETHSLP